MTHHTRMPSLSMSQRSVCTEMQLVPGHSLLEEFVVLEGCCRRVRCEELTNNVLVFHQLESCLWSHERLQICSMQAFIQKLRSETCCLVPPVLAACMAIKSAHCLAGEGVCQKRTLSSGFPACPELGRMK